MKSLGQVGYEAYGALASWKTFDGRSMPTWEQLGETDTGRETQRRWEGAALAITSEVAAAMSAAMNARLAER